MNQKELAQMSLDALNNPLNIYHDDVRYAIGVLAGWFNLSYEQCVQKIRNMTK